MKANLLNRILLVLGFIGLFIAGVLALEAAANVMVPCGTSGGCQTVANHPTSRLAGIPVSYLGVLGYLALTGLAIARAVRGVHASRPLVTAGYVLAAIGVLGSLWLQFISFVVIRATCIWCLSSAVVMFLTLIGYTMLTQELNVRPEPPEGGTPKDIPLIAGLPVALGIGLAVMAFTLEKSAPNPDLQTEKLAKVQMIPDRPNSWGQPDSPLTIVEFADILCPGCQTMSPKVKEFVAARPGKVRLIFRHFPLHNVHPFAMHAAAISEAAAEEGKFWDFTLAVMALGRQPESVNELMEIAKASGLDTMKLRTKIKDKDNPIYTRVAEDLKVVKEIGINATPTFFLMSKGKVLSVESMQNVMKKLNSPEMQAIMNGSDA